jgi:magnesium chelatase subunit D
VTGEAGDDELRRRLVDAAPAALPDEVIEFAARLAVNVGAESLRADLVLCRAAAALAGWEQRPAATEEDVERVAPLALGHRHRRRPFDPPTLPPQDLSDALDRSRNQDRSEAEDDPEPQSTPSGPAPERRWDELAEEASKARLALESLAPPPLYARDQSRSFGSARSAKGKRPVIEGGPGPTVGHRMPGPGGADGGQGIAVVPTVRAAMQRRQAEPGGPALAADDVRVPRRVRKQARTIVLVVDASGSMGTASRVTAATGAVLGLLADAYLRRDQVALIAFRGEGATEVLPPTASVELARSHLHELPTGGATPLAEGLETALRTAQRVAAQGSLPLLVVLTDGRATGAPDALDRAREVSRAIATAGIDTVVLDAEDGNARLGLAAELVALMDGRYLHLAEVTAEAVETAVRTTLADS